MSETAFAKAFMSAMDKKPIRMSSDYVADPRKYPAQSPAILPRPTHPYPRRQRPDVASKPATISVTLKPMKASSDPLTLPDQSIDTTVLDLKTQYAAKMGLDVYKIKMLLNKRPCQDLKTLKDILPTPTPADAEFTLMIMGGFSAAAAPSTPPAKAPSPAIQSPESSSQPDPTTSSTASAPLSERAQEDSVPAHISAPLIDDEFWADLTSFLVQRLKDQAEGERLSNLFRRAATS